MNQCPYCNMYSHERIMGGCLNPLCLKTSDQIDDYDGYVEDDEDEEPTEQTERVEK